jgi:hypothetical protein
MRNFFAILTVFIGICIITASVILGFNFVHEITGWKMASIVAGLVVFLALLAISIMIAYALDLLD